MIGIVTQARINSNRLPNKILLEAAGHSFLQESGLCDTERAREFEGDKRAALGVFFSPRSCLLVLSFL